METIDTFDATRIFEPNHQEARCAGLPVCGGIPYVLNPGEGRTISVGGLPYSFKATEETTSGRMTILEAPVRPQTGPPAHIHHWHDEYFFVLAGRFDFLAGETIFEVGPGGFVSVPRGTVHRFKCISETEGRVLGIIMPGGMEGFFEDIGRLRPDVPPPPGLLERLYRVYGYELVGGKESGEAAGSPRPATR